MAYLTFTLYNYNLTSFLQNFLIFKILFKHSLEDVWHKYLLFFSFTQFFSLFGYEDITISSLDLCKRVLPLVSRKSCNFFLRLNWFGVLSIRKWKYFQNMLWPTPTYSEIITIGLHTKILAKKVMCKLAL